MNLKIDWSRLLLAAAYLALLGLVVIGLASCKSVEKYKASPDFAKDCAKAFPVKTDSIYIEGQEVHDTTYLHTTVTLPPEYFTDTAIITRTIKVPCPAAITRTRIDTIIKVKSDSAVIRVLLDDLAALDVEVGKHKADVTKWQERAKGRGKTNIILALAVAGLLFEKGYRLKKKYFS